MGSSEIDQILDSLPSEGTAEYVELERQIASAPKIKPRRPPTKEPKGRRKNGEPGGMSKTNGKPISRHS